MVGVRYASFCVAYGNMHQWQDFPHVLFVIHDDCLMGGCRSVLHHGGITAVAIRGHGGVTVSPLTDFADKGGSLEIIDDLHFYMPDSLGCTIMLLDCSGLGPTAFCHDEDGSLALASTPPFERTVLLVFRCLGGEKAFVHLHSRLITLASELVRIPADTRSPIPVISVQSVGDLQYRWQS